MRVADWERLKSYAMREPPPANPVLEHLTPELFFGLAGGALLAVAGHLSAYDATAWQFYLYLATVGGGLVCALVCIALGTERGRTAASLRAEVLEEMDRLEAQFVKVMPGEPHEAAGPTQ